MILFINGKPRIYNKSEFKSDKEYYSFIMKLSKHPIFTPVKEKESLNMIFYNKQLNKL
jgi:hypothetical protein